jgi:enoyl-CoA hydratase/carnithine racemase
MFAVQTPKGFLLDRHEAVVTVRLHNPATLNSLTFDSYRELLQTFRALASDPCRAVIVTGEGRGFCSGGGVHDIIAPLLELPAAEKVAFTRMTCDLVLAMRALRKPVVAAVNGIAAGAGALLALAADLRLLSVEAKIAFLFVKVGLSGADMGAAWLLPRLVGLGRAADLLLTGRTVEAEEALHIGLANRVVPHASLLAEAQALAASLAAGPPFALAMTKEMLEREAAMSFETALEAEAQAQALCMETPEFREGYRAFVEKRAPSFVPSAPPGPKNRG